MKGGLAAFVCFLCFCGCGSPPQNVGDVPAADQDVDAYLTARTRLSRAERAMRIGADMKLTPAEEEAERRLMSLKQEEIERTGEYFPPAQSFLRSKTRRLIEPSPILEIMKRLPKGGILHVHGLAMGDFRWLVKNATYLRDCYIYQGQEEPPRKGTMRIFAEPPGGGWRLISDLRQAADNVEAFDEELYRSLTLGEEDLDQPDLWLEFRKCFARSLGLFTDEVRDGFCRKLLKDIIAENVQYVETRSDIGSQDIIKEIQRDHPEFMVKYIFSAPRSDSRERLTERLARALDIREENPSFMVGFDLVDEEDKYHTNLYFINELLAARREESRRGITLPFYLHSGESSWR